MGPAIDAVMAGTEALLFGRRTYQTVISAAAGRSRAATATRSPTG
jgi:hypothetical protein